MKHSAQQLVYLVLTLARDGELDILPEVVSGEELALTSELGALVGNFNYLDSLAFADVTRGKPPAVVSAWRRRVMEPVKRGELREEFYDNVRRILSDGQMEKYLPPDAASQVEAIRRKLEAVSAI
jgi:hypothetical protein